MGMNEDSGPAFPIIVGKEICSIGMTLRDWFAGQALAGILADPNACGPNIVKISASSAYQFADAMLEARK